MDKITESAVERFTIEQLEQQGYQYIYAPSIAPDSETPERQSFEDVLVVGRLQSSIGRINPSIPADIREDAIKQTAIANNDSARELMEKDKLRELAVVLFEKVKANASIDWTIKESVKAKLKVIVKRTLRQYGYPPDMQKLATETVLKQAELIAEEITRGE